MEKNQLALTKTDKVLRALIGVCKFPEDRISEDALCELLDNPSRAQKYKLIAELLSQKDYRPAILVKFEEGTSISYGLNEEFYKLILKN
ncbi:MAG: hypothetical protein K9K67_11660 [Bacteriovoracaceae bacterium]|nr:hypothetical protein [Bacteriovoracaceae bacterium]